MKALRVHVERIVRPVRASVPRKNKMREELLGHLTTAYNEERESGSSENEAVAHATRRLGDPDALRRELQASVPAIERVMHVRIPILAPEFDEFEGCSTLSFAARFTAVVMGFLVVGAPLLAGIAVRVASTAGRGLFHPRHLTMQCLLTLAGMLALLAVALFVALLLFDFVGGRRVVSRSSNSSPFLKACMTTGLWMVAIAFFLAMAIPFGDYVNRDSPGLVAVSVVFAAAWRPLAWFLLLTPVACIVTMTFGFTFERRQYEEWGCLDIDSEADTNPDQPA